MTESYYIDALIHWRIDTLTHWRIDTLLEVEVVSVFAFHYNKPSSNPAEVDNFLLYKSYLKRMKTNEKDAGNGSFFVE